MTSSLIPSSLTLLWRCVSLTLPPSPPHLTLAYLPHRAQSSPSSCFCSCVSRPLPQLTTPTTNTPCTEDQGFTCLPSFCQCHIDQTSNVMQDYADWLAAFLCIIKQTIICLLEKKKTYCIQYDYSLVSLCIFGKYFVWYMLFGFAPSQENMSSVSVSVHLYKGVAGQHIRCTRSTANMFKIKVTELYLGRT